MFSVAFYTEAGSKRGMGHLVRCYTLFQYFQKYTTKVEFFIDSDRDYSDSFEALNSFRWDTLQCNKNYDAIFIDSYEADISIYKKLFHKTKLLICIDDYERLDYPAGIIINFAPDAKELFFKNKKSDTIYLLGLKYIPIREELQNTDKEKKEQIFIMLGGSDIFNISENILNAIKDTAISKVIVINDKTVAKKLKNYPYTKVLYKPKNSELVTEMARSLLAISTASMTLYELSFLNIPTIIIALTYNQKLGASQLIKHNLAKKLLDIEQENWENRLKEFIKEILSTQSFHKKQIIDAKGSKRIFTAVKKRLKL